MGHIQLQKNFPKNRVETIITRDKTRPLYRECVVKDVANATSGLISRKRDTEYPFK
jgi:hypothetical protein